MKLTTRLCLVNASNFPLLGSCFIGGSKFVISGDGDSVSSTRAHRHTSPSFPLAHTCTVSSFPDAFPCTDVVTHGQYSFARSRSITLAVGVPMDGSLSRIALPSCQLCEPLDASAVSVREDIVLSSLGKKTEVLRPQGQANAVFDTARSLMLSEHI